MRKKIVYTGMRQINIIGLNKDSIIKYGANIFH